VSDRPQIVVLDDYEDSLRRTADWSPVTARAELRVYTERLRGAALLAAIRDADAIAVVRDRTPFRAELLGQLPRLRYFCFTGERNTQLDAEAFAARGIPIGHTAMGSSKASTCELTWALLLAAAKRLEEYSALVRAGLIGLGEIGQRVARVGQAFGMEVVAWSPHLTPERAAQGGAQALPLEELLATSHAVSLHLVPSDATRRLLDAARLARMRPDAILVNTARSALIDMAALPAALDAGRPAVAALDVFDDEPLPPGHPLAQRPDVLLTPHLGFVNDPVFAGFGPGVVANLLGWLNSI
jgi:phosphoglycerate dehydrogenase-like enzyme